MDASPIAADRSAVALRLRTALPWTALVLAVGAAALLGIGPLGWRWNWWHYRVAFSLLIPSAGYLGIAAMAVAALSLAAWRRRRAVALALGAFAIGAAVAYVPWHYTQMRGTFALINDITTDPDNPPVFIKAAAARRAENANSADYAGAALAEQQRKFYPDLAPALLPSPPDQAFARALSVAQAQGWTITETDAETGHIEAFDRSRWFHFIDDIAIRITSAAQGSRIDIRSSSRMGRSDFGVNARRIRRFLAALSAPG